MEPYIADFINNKKISRLIRFLITSVILIPLIFLFIVLTINNDLVLGKIFFLVFLDLLIIIYIYLILNIFREKQNNKNLLMGFVFGLIAIGTFNIIILEIIQNFSKVEVDANVLNYNNYIGEDAIDNYKNKYGMDESIFPKKISEEMEIIDFKMVYYNPWDAEYLSYLVVAYGEKDYKRETKRLQNYNSTNYIGYYSVTGFSKYKLLAINADPYQGFVYALTDNNNKIIYIELIFCDYDYDIDYKKYINTDYLPDGFDATTNNIYKKQYSKGKI